MEYPKLLKETRCSLRRLPKFKFKRKIEKLRCKYKVKISPSPDTN